MLDLGHGSLACRVLVPPRPCESLRSAALERLPAARTLHPRTATGKLAAPIPPGAQEGWRGAHREEGSIGHHRPHLRCTLARGTRGVCAWERVPAPGAEALTDQQAQHVQQHEDPPPLHVAPAQGRPRPPLVPAVPAAPGSHGVETARPRERAGLDERARARRRRGWGRA